MVDAGVEVVEGTPAVFREQGVSGDRLVGGGAEWCVDAVEDFQEQDADPETLRGETVALGLGDFDDQALGTELGQVTPARVRGWSGPDRFLCPSDRHML